MSSNDPKNPGPSPTLDGGADDAAVLELARTAFSHVRTGDALQLGALLDAGLSLGLRNERGDSLLMLASYHGHVDATRLLLERGADPELTNDAGQTPLAGAAFKGNLAITTLLLDRGARVDGAGPDGRTPLMFAAMFDKLEVLELLLQRGANPEQRDAAQRTARDYARSMGAQRAAARLESLSSQTP
ncbi:ankyrin repeat domain-containing protein [Corallococcus sp. CA053C]|uniref:ankyrin repeat domain-containing protein n=1 Tax=Corallococcus sp. CA053C TaxID=2316732 RepID=UPI000EA2D169|nr:ankyrin repeat domain-containing protein [Corallococcus sp. CA053C]RKH14429.1 ankyrin repeat domain-containing protein [Corallococcus sp. CA053C]